ncbi:MAG: alpha-glucosidase/alpha-galactosidase, partial [Spirochaetota bacterium]
EVPKEEITYTCGGTNHMNWFLTLKHGNQDLYPRLREVLERPAYYKADKVRAEVFRHFGYFMTETTGHLSEYVPWFRKNRAALELYCNEPGFGGESGAYYQWCRTVADKYAERSPLEFESPELEQRSIEYCSYIMEAMTTGRPFRFMGNVRNDGFIANLPDGCCVEVPCFADDTGVHPVSIGELPPQCAALNRTQVNVHLLTAQAALHGDPELVVHALAMDPLTGAVCTLKEIRDMASEMLESQRRWLPRFEGKQVRPAPVISIPEGTRAMHAPPDPAQALLKRFIKLAE